MTWTLTVLVSGCCLRTFCTQSKSTHIETNGTVLSSSPRKSIKETCFDGFDLLSVVEKHNVTRKTFTRCLWKRSTSPTLFCSLHCLIYSSFLLFVNLKVGGESGLNHMKNHRSVFYNNFCKVIRKITYLQLEIWHSDKYVGEERNVVLVDARNWTILIYSYLKNHLLFIICDNLS